MNPTQDNPSPTQQPQENDKLNFFQGAPEEPQISTPANAETTTEVQLPSETPMQLETIPDQPAVSSIAPTPEPTPIEITPQAVVTPAQPEVIATVAPTPSIPEPVVSTPAPINTSSNIQFENTPDFAISSAKPTNQLDSQKLIMIVAGILGVLIVFGGGFFILRSRNSQANNTPVVAPVVEQTTPAIQETPAVTETPMTQTQTTPQVNSVALTIETYKAEILKVETKTLTTIKNTPINVASNTQSIDQIRFASDDLFANYQALLNLQAPETAKPLHTQLVTNYKLLVDSYDVVLKSLKETNKISPEAKAQFSGNYNKAVSGINDALSKIKALK